VETKLFYPQQENNAVAEAAAILRRGGLVGIPTETVYGLGANGLNEDAVRRIFEAKGRPQDNPLILHVASADWLERYCKDVPQAAYELAARFWPGPLTMILPRRDCVPLRTTGGLETVGVRCPDHAVTLQIIEAAGVPVAAPSGNTSGRPSPTCARHVYEDMQNRIPLILDGGDCQVGVESTVLSVTGDTPVILRPGKVTQLEIAQVTGKCLIADSVMRPLREGESAPSPGMKHRHYAPRGNMTIVQGTDEKKVVATLKRMYLSSENACILCHENLLAAFPGMRVFSLGNSPEDTARVLFSLLRDMDALKISRILCQGWDTGGVGLAVMNRMARAASFDIIEAE